jgi:hypothetical protein
MWICRLEKGGIMGQAKQRGTYEERLKQAKKTIKACENKFFNQNVKAENKNGWLMLYEYSDGHRATFRSFYDVTWMSDIKADLRKAGFKNRNDYASAVKHLFNKYNKYFSLDMFKTAPQNIQQRMNMCCMAICAYLTTFKSYDVLVEKGGYGIIASAKEVDRWNPHGKDEDGGCIVFHDSIPIEVFEIATKEWQAKIATDPEFLYSEIFNEYFRRNDRSSHKKAVGFAPPRAFKENA